MALDILQLMLRKEREGRGYVVELANDALYSGTSDEGPSEIGMNSLQRTLALANIVREAHTVWYGTEQKCPL